MRLLLNDMEHFFLKRKYSPTRAARYNKLFPMFAEYIASRTQKPVEAIDLNRIYCLKDQTGNMIKHLPIDEKIIDSYFSSHHNASYCFLIDTRHVLVSFFDYLERNYDFRNPMKHITFDFKQYKPLKRPSKCLTKHEILKLLNAILNHSVDYERDLMFFSLLISTGCRISEIIHLQVYHFNFSSDTFKLKKTKNKRERNVIMLKGMGISIHQYCKQRGYEQDSFLFYNESGKPLSVDNARKLLDTYRNIASIQKIHLHATRHTFATVMYDAGSNISIIQQLLGQSRPDVAQVYIHSNSVRNRYIKISKNEMLYNKLKAKTNR